MNEVLWIALLNATWETIYMVFVASFLSISLGTVLGVLVFLSRDNQALAHKGVHHILNGVINVTRSIPFIILMISILPFIRFLVGTTIGTNAAIVPLTLAAIPFYARICENALAEIPQGLFEAAHSMGATTWQMISKIMLPESLPTLIRGATLTIVSLIGYSAMAGVVGGGGLGELAINYGYQRFDFWVMMETVILLVIIVQGVQFVGDRLAHARKIKPLITASVVLWLVCVGSQLWPLLATHPQALRVGVMTGWPQQVMQVAQQEAQSRYDLQLEVIAFDDYVLPNTALNDGSIDANIFQHVPYLKAQINAHHYPLVVIGKTFVYPMGFYSKKVTQLSQLPNHAIIAIPNDPSNQGRALLLLQKAGLIKLRTGVTTLANVNDIIANRKQLQFKQLNAAQLPRVLEDASLVAITNDFIGASGLTIKQAILKEGSDSLYANVIVARFAEANTEPLKQLVAVMHSTAVVKATQQLFPDGAAIDASGIKKNKI